MNVTRPRAIIMVLPAVCLATAVLARIAGEDSPRTPPPQSQPQTSQPRASWWFPSEVATAVEQEFHVTYTVTDTTRGRSNTSVEEADFAVAIRPAGAGRGAMYELQAERDTQWGTGLVRAALTLLINSGANKLRINPRDVLIDGEPLLRGPWREGERFSIVCFVWFFEVTTGVAHWEVESATEKEVKLKCRFWVGRHGPKIRGEAHLTIQKDKDGIHFARYTDHWRNDSAERRTELIVKRTRSRPIRSR